MAKARVADRQATSPARASTGSRPCATSSRAIPADVTLTSLTGDISTGAGGGGSTLRSAISAPAITLQGCAPGQTAGRPPDGAPARHRRRDPRVAVASPRPRRSTSADAPTAPRPSSATPRRAAPASARRSRSSCSSRSDAGRGRHHADDARPAPVGATPTPTPDRRRPAAPARRPPPPRPRPPRRPPGRGDAVSRTYRILLVARRGGRRRRRLLEAGRSRPSAPRPPSSSSRSPSPQAQLAQTQSADRHLPRRRDALQGQLRHGRPPRQGRPDRRRHALAASSSSTPPPSAAASTSTRSTSTAAAAPRHRPARATARPGAINAGAFSAMPFSLRLQRRRSPRCGDFFSRLERFVTLKGDKIAVNGRLLRVESIALTPAESGWPALQRPGRRQLLHRARGPPCRRDRRRRHDRPRRPRPRPPRPHARPAGATIR